MFHGVAVAFSASETARAHLRESVIGYMFLLVTCEGTGNGHKLSGICDFRNDITGYSVGFCKGLF